MKFNNIFKNTINYVKKEKSPDQMSLDERLDKGLTTFDEAANYFAEKVVSGCASYIANREMLKKMRLRQKASSFTENIYMQRCIDLDASLADLRKSSIEYTQTTDVSIKKKAARLASTSVAGIAELEYRLKVLMDKRGDGYSKEEVIRRCLTPSVLEEGTQKALSTYAVPVEGVSPVPPTADDLSMFIDILDKVNECLDQKKPLYNDNGFLVDVTGKLIEEDIVEGWVLPDASLFEQLKNKNTKQLFERYVDETPDMKAKLFTYLVNNFHKNAAVYAECKKEVSADTQNSDYASLIMDGMVTDSSFLIDYIKRNVGEENLTSFKKHCTSPADESLNETARELYDRAMSKLAM